MQPHATYEQLNALDLWNNIGHISLDEMRAVKLMNRVDTKFVLSQEDVLKFLKEASRLGYRVQINDGIFASRYDTLYFDTEERAMYVAHHNRQLTRQKIRSRCYVESGTTFIEVKNKSNRGRTSKRRIEIPRERFSDFWEDSEANGFITPLAHHSIETLLPSLSTRFIRITLVNPDLSERITIDLNLRYEDVRSGRSATINGMAIAELKQEGHGDSTTKRIFNQMGIKSLKVSKYCLGTALTVKGIKRNRMLEKIRTIEKRLGYNRIIINDVK